MTSAGTRRGIMAAVFLLVALRVSAAPYSDGGLLTEWTQPDGTELTLRVFGDEFYARTTTKDGYTVVFEPSDNTYYFATLGPDGKSLVTTGVPAQEKLPEGMAASGAASAASGLPKHIKECKDVIATTREKNINKFAPDRAANWARRVEAVVLQRSQSAGTSLAADPSASSSSGSDALAAAISGSRVGLMILAQFPDDPATTAADPVNFPTTQAKVVRYCNEAGYTDDGNTGSIRDYYYDQSNGLLTLTHVVTAAVTLPHPRNYYNYADYPNNSSLRDSGSAGRALVNDAIAKLKTDGFDFSALSVDSSGNVIATSLLFAGSDSGVWSRGLWPHSWSLSTRVNVGTTASPRYISKYQCTNAASAALVIGTVCHELGHLVMGYPDFYDYGGDSEGVGNHCLMGAGNYGNGGKTPAPLDLYLKDFSGWANITDLAVGQEIDVTLASTGNRGYRIRNSAATTDYFLVENRGTGDKWAAYCPDKGIAIWHVDENVSGNDNQQMTPSQHYELSLEQADGRFDMENDKNRGDSTDLFDNGGVFNNSTNPNANWWSGSVSGISISVLSAAGASMNVRFGASTSGATLSVNPTAMSATVAGGTFNFAVVSNTTWSWSDNATWVTSAEATTQTGDQTFTYALAANTGTAARNAVITLTDGVLTRTHTITQAGTSADDHGNTIATATVVAQNSTTNGNFELAGDNDYFRINVTAAGVLTVETTGTTDTYGYLLDSSGNQLAADDETGVDSNFRISYSVAAGTYYVCAKHYAPTETGIYQLVCSFAPASSLSLALSPVAQSVVAGGETPTFNVSSNTAWSWSTNASWVTSNEAASQSGNQAFTYTVAANPSTSSRTAVINLTAGSLSATHTITQAGTSPDDHGNSIATATLVAQNSTTAGNIESAGDNDFFRINFTGPGTLTVEATGGSDTYGYLLDSSGTQLAADDDSGADSNFLISSTVSAGTYYVQVKHYSSTGTGSYQLISSFAEASPLEVNPTTQSVVAGGETPTFNVSSNMTWSWSVNASWVTSTEPATQTGNQAFTYTVAANPSTSSRTAAITLAAGNLSATHTITQAGAVPDDHGNTTATATVIDQNSTAAGNIETPGDNDYFRIDVAIPGILTVETTGSGDTYGYLLDSSGTQLAADDDSGVDSNFRISYAASAGTYYIRARYYSSTTTGAYQLVSSLQTRTLVLGGNFAFGSVMVGANATSTVTLSNTGNAALAVSGITYPSGFSGDWSGGTIAAGSSQNVTVTFAPTAVQPYTGTLTITSDMTSGNNTATLTGNGVTAQKTSVAIFDLTTDPGWTRQGEWAFGNPTGGGGSPGSPDPTSGATGLKIFGVNLKGNYSTAVGGPYYLTTGPINLAGYSGTQLRFKRWLNTDCAPYAYATIEVSNDGTNWVNIFTNPLDVEIADSAWTTQTYTLGSGMDNKPTVYIRWGYRVASNAWAYSGWNIDDVEVSGVSSGTSAPEIAVEQPVGTNIADSGSKDFGSVAVGSNASLTFTIKNTGTANLTGLAITKDGINAADFTITSSPVAPVSGPNGTATFTVNFAPGAAGSRTAAIHIASNDSDENPFDINLSGTGTAALSPYEIWLASNFTGADISSGRATMTGDFDKDGLPNLLEYAFGTNPKTSDPSGIEANVTADKMSISFTCDDSRKDLIYTVQSSSDLAPNSWTDIAQSTGGGPVTPVSGRSSVSDPGSGARTATVSTTLPAGGKLFLRVKAAK